MGWIEHDEANLKAKNLIWEINRHEDSTTRKELTYDSSNYFGYEIDAVPIFMVKTEFGRIHIPSTGLPSCLQWMESSANKFPLQPGRHCFDEALQLQNTGGSSLKRSLIILSSTNARENHGNENQKA